MSRHAITPTDKGLPPNPLYEHTPTRSARVWVDPMDHSKGKVDVVVVDGMKWAEIVGPGAVAGKVSR